MVRHDSGLQPAENPKNQWVPNRLETRQDLLIRLFNENYSSLVRLASFLLDDISICEEVVQDAFVKMQVAKARPQSGREAAYLRSVVLNGARSHMRRRMVRQRLVLDPQRNTASVEQSVIDSTERQFILKKLRQLPRRQAEVLMLRFYMDLSEEEIAETLKISKGSVKTHTSRALDKMGQLLDTGARGEAPDGESE